METPVAPEEPPAPPPAKKRLKPKYGVLALAGLGLVLFVAFPGRAFRTEGAWIRVEDPRAGHRVSMPAPPTREVGEVELLGATVRRERTSVREFGRTYALTRFDLGGTELLYMDPEELLDSLRDRWMRRTGGDLTLERSFEFAHQPARELVVTAGSAGRAEILHRARVLFFGGSLYRLEYRGPYATVSPTDLEAFFGSFRGAPERDVSPQLP